MLDKMSAMIFKAVGLKPHSWLNRAAGWTGWKLMQLNAWTLRGYRPAATAVAYYSA